MSRKINTYKVMVESINKANNFKKTKDLFPLSPIIASVLKPYELAKEITSPMQAVVNSYTVLESKQSENLKNVLNMPMQGVKDLFAPSPIVQRLLDWHKEIKNFTNDFEQQKEDLQQYWVYNLTVEELETTKLQLEAKTKELENFKAEFRKFYERTQPSEKPQTTNKQKDYSFDCDLDKIKIVRLYELCFKDFFECDINDIVNLFSEKISTNITMKTNIKLIDVISFFSALHNEKIIKSTHWANTIDKAGLIIFRGKPITATQIKDTKKMLKLSYKDFEVQEKIQHAIK